jgi:7-cyano-7-deazaguanine synthase
MVADHLSIRLHEVTVDLSCLGKGLLVGLPGADDSPSPEWFPFRNQYLVTIAASIALSNGYQTVVLGLVAGDGERHADGTRPFITALDKLVAIQEGGVRVTAPHVDMPTTMLLQLSGVSVRVLRRTHSCHVGNLACGQCPGCHRRTAILAGLG